MWSKLRAAIAKYQVTSHPWRSRNRYNIRVEVETYPKNAYIRIVRNPGHNDCLYLELVVRPRKPFVYFAKDTLPF